MIVVTRPMAPQPLVLTYLKGGVATDDRSSEDVDDYSLAQPSLWGHDLPPLYTEEPKSALISTTDGMQALDVSEKGEGPTVPPLPPSGDRNGGGPPPWPVGRRQYVPLYILAGLSATIATTTLLKKYDLDEKIFSASQAIDSYEPVLYTLLGALSLAAVTPSLSRFTGRNLAQLMDKIEKKKPHDPILYQRSLGALGFTAIFFGAAFLMDQYLEHTKTLLAVATTSGIGTAYAFFKDEINDRVLDFMTATFHPLFKYLKVGNEIEFRGHTWRIYRIDWRYRIHVERFDQDDTRYIGEFTYNELRKENATVVQHPKHPSDFDEDTITPA